MFEHVMFEHVMFEHACSNMPWHVRRQWGRQGKCDTPTLEVP
jgi:hypothetical protein